jgi:predicted membrane protein
MRMNNSQRTNTITGTVIILFGIAALLGSFGLFNFGDLIASWWPLLVIGGGLLALYNNPKKYGIPLLVIAVGILWQLQELNVIQFNAWQLFWPAVIIAIGWSFITTGKLSKPRSDATDNISVFLGGIESKNETKDYQGGKLSAIMGGGSLDLRHATIKKEATLEIFTLMGGFELKVPEGWVVRSSITPILGGVENKTVTATKKDAPVLMIIGTAVMGGIEIKH